MDDLLTIAEVADRLKLNQQTVRNWIDRGELPAVRVGSRRIRIRREDFEERFGPGRLQPVEAAPDGNSDSPAPIAEQEVTDALRAFAGAALQLALALERSRP